MTVEELMTRHVYTVSPHDSLNEAARLMWEYDCGCIPVVGDGAERGRLIGMLTDCDICMAAYTQGRPLADIPVGSAMARDVRACRPGDSVPETLALLNQHQLRRLPVVDGDRAVVGIVSLTDFAHAATAKASRGHRPVTPAAVAVTLAAIGAPHGGRIAGAAGARPPARRPKSASGSKPRAGRRRAE